MLQGFLGEKLRLVRQFHGLSLADLGDRVEASRQYIHQLESDAKAPTGDMESALAAALNVEPSFFRFPLKNSVKVEQTHFRKLRSTPVALVHQILAHGTMCESLISYFDAHLSLPPVNFPEFRVASGSDIEKAARACREYWKLGTSDPIPNFTRVLENAGAVVVNFKSISAQFDALSMSRARPIVVRSTSKKSLCRQRFDLAHECAHLIFHQGIQTGDKETEHEAHRFAGALLLPETEFRKEFPAKTRIDWRAIYSMKLKWKMSVQAIIQRAHDLDLMDKAQFRKARIQLQRNGQIKQEKFDDRMPLEQPELLSKCFEILLENKRLFFTGIAADLHVKPQFLMNLISFLDLYEEVASHENQGAGESNVIHFRDSYFKNA